MILTILGQWAVNVLLQALAYSVCAYGVAYAARKGWEAGK